MLKPTSTYSPLKWAYILFGWGLALYALGRFLAYYNQIVPGGLKY